MTRLTLAALARMAKATAATDPPTVTIVTHPEPGGGRYAAWPYGCVLLPARLLEDLAFPPDGTYTITAKGLGEPAEDPGFPVDRMLALLDAPRIPATPSGWLYERGPARMRLFRRPDLPPIAVIEDRWDAWTRAIGDGPVWQTTDWAIAWAPDETTRATALLGSVHAQHIPALPVNTLNQCPLCEGTTL